MRILRMAFFVVAALAMAGGARATPIAEALLRLPSFAPTDINLFSSVLYGGTAALPAAPYAVDETALRNSVQTILTGRFGGDAAKIQQGMSVFDDPQITPVAPDPRLRAALALLSGTVGQGAIDAIRSGVYSSVEFGIPPANGAENNNAIAQVVDDVGNPGKLKIIVSDRYQYEDTRLFATALSHEVLHEDIPNTQREELINTATESAVYGQFLNEDPSLALENTELTQRYNTRLMGLVNSRDAQGDIHILSSDTPNVYPGSNAPPLPYFGWAYVAQGLGSVTPGNPALNSALSLISGQTITGADFDDAALTLLDSTINDVFTPDQWIGLARDLKLDVPALADLPEPDSLELLATVLAGFILFRQRKA